MTKLSFSLLALNVFIFSSTCRNLPRQNLPQVDLGYSVVQALEDSPDSENYYFENIRYAEPPTGENRFAAPIPAATVNRTVNDGTNAVICPQGIPLWLAKLYSMDVTEVDPRTNEDCLFLDVVVPQGGFNAREKKGIMPVLVWIHGGGFALGQKSDMVTHLLSEAKKSDNHGIIYVSFNYRLGIFGWLGGPIFQDMGGLPNAGLYDQRLALQWIRKNIHLFGGDPDNVTVMGESAGGGSIMYQITAYGGEPPDLPPFKQAIIQSPGFSPNPSTIPADLTTKTFLNLTNSTALKDARTVSFEKLREINQQIIGEVPYGSFGFTPVIDGKFVTDLPGKLLLHNSSFNPTVNLLIGHNSDEGALFVNPNITTATDFLSQVVGMFPTISHAALDYVNRTLYPAIFDEPSKYPYTNHLERASLLFAETVFTCNTNYLARAYLNQTYNYFFNLEPGLHGQDLSYTFYESSSLGLNENVAVALQDFITSFSVTGNPNLRFKGVTEGPTAQFPVYGDAGRVAVLSGNGTNLGIDPAHNERCVWWQQVLWEGQGHDHFES